VVNGSFVKRYFPKESAIGKRIIVEKILPTHRGLGPKTASEIVGVVGLEQVSEIGAYASFGQTPVSGLGIVHSGSGSPEMLLKSVQRAYGRSIKTKCSTAP
jgi:hypothetical protein